MKLNKKIILIGTVASSFYGFRADLIRTFLKKGHQVYAFTSEYTAEDLKKIEKLGATPITYTLNRGGLNRLADMIARYQLSKEVKDDVSQFSTKHKEHVAETLQRTKNNAVEAWHKVKEVDEKKATEEEPVKKEKATEDVK